ncbi:MAG: isoprenylcysteine carboxylmethyltransferase family protein [Anaerolineales bacterium]|nr:isoprenylcysteine carboxylmethyltransferase family protein [Chloroflexota bacterium]MBL6983634.1 isoprenylcysteine carboxylmethyltransferase family protein [Anaerolineales bacterium]
MSSDALFRIIQSFVFVAFIANRAYYNRKFPPAEEDTIEKQSETTLTKIANYFSILALISLLIYLIVPRYLIWASLPLPTWVRWVGVLLALDGFALLFWSHAALGENWSDQPRITTEQKFISEGPYRWIRHPIYTAFIAILGSSLLITSNWLVGGLWLVITSVDIAPRIKFEEEMVLEKFGEQYRSYLNRTGALLPHILMGKKN